tara:strand:- start:583 stop:1410 length:828 start_codon:yes stop_codon:yes gene_type:complete
MGHYKYPPFSLLKDFKGFLVNNRGPMSMIDERFELCELPVVSRVEEGSHAFIGHAYGAPGKANEADFLALNVLNFMQKNKQKLSSVSFTGDVFSVPSLKKWKRLSRDFTGEYRIFIAPGNHDVARPDSLDVFNSSPFAVHYPFVEKLDGVPVIYENSISSNWLISSETLKLVNSFTSQNVIIARHNMPVAELEGLANSSSRMSTQMLNLNEFVKRFRAGVSYTWLIGDSGAFPQLPRIFCYQYSNHTFIGNGIGEVLGDSIVLFKDGQFSIYELK